MTRMELPDTIDLSVARSSAPSPCSTPPSSSPTKP